MRRGTKLRGGWFRGGAVAVEMAIVTPLLLTVLFGIIEYGWAFSVRQAMVNAAREGARVAALQGSTDTDIRSRVSTYLTPMHLSGYETTLTHATQQNPTETVQVQIPYANVSLVGHFFGEKTGNITGTCSMRKEGM